MSPQKQRTTFAKQQRERARMEKAAEKRKRREARKLGLGFVEALVRLIALELEGSVSRRGDGYVRRMRRE